MIQKLLCLMSFTFFFGYGAIAAPIKISLKEFVVALKPDKNPEKMQEEKQKLEIFLAAQLGIPVKVIVPLSSAVILEGLKNGSVDLGYLGSLDMLIAQKQNAATVLLAGQIKGKSSYESFWLVKKESTYKSIADLKNKPRRFR